MFVLQVQHVPNQAPLTYLTKADVKSTGRKQTLPTILQLLPVGTELPPSSHQEQTHEERQTPHTCKCFYPVHHKYLKLQLVTWVYIKSQTLVMLGSYHRVTQNKCWSQLINYANHNLLIKCIVLVVLCLYRNAAVWLIDQLVEQILLIFRLRLVQTSQIWLPSSRLFISPQTGL